MTTTTTATYLEQQRTAMGLSPRKHAPAWRMEAADERFVWLFDGDRAVGLVDTKEDNFELRVGDPWSACPPAEVPKHYHICTYTGLRVINHWRMRGGNTKLLDSSYTFEVGDAVVVTMTETYSDGSVGVHRTRLYYDAAWNAYIAEITADLTARRILMEQEYCNLIPVAIGDTRPGRAKYQQTVWTDTGGVLRGMGKNPLWYVSVGAQDLFGVRGIPAGGFLGWVAEPDFNPVAEIVEANTPIGAGTCDALMDEHLMIHAPDARHCPDGWFRLHVVTRLFSIPPVMADALAAQTTRPEFGPMLAWKFQYAPHEGPIAADLNRVPLPGMPSYGVADLNTPVPWDEPCFTGLWTASSLPEADLYWDPEIGHAGCRSLRVTVNGQEKHFIPGSGPTTHTEAGQRYRIGAWIRTRGDVRAWVEGNEILFQSFRPVTTHATDPVGPDSEWTWAETSYTAIGDDAPFMAFNLVAEGTGMAWFDEMTFVPMEG
jgi:hypothetical protein